MTEEKLIINNLSIEMTRQCQLNCQHCLRGPSQKRYTTPDLDALTQLLKNIEYVSSITFTGGEPTLVSFLTYQFIIDSFKQAKVGIGNFYIATNGISLLKPHTEEEFYHLISFLYANCDDNEISSIKFSRDYYHQNELSSEKNRLINQKLNKLERLFNEDFVQVDTNDEYLINQGNAAKHDLGSRNVSTYLEIDENRIDGDLYLNCKGNVLAACDLSYRSQDNKKYIISSAKNFNLQACLDYQYKNQTS